MVCGVTWHLVSKSLLCTGAALGLEIQGLSDKWVSSRGSPVYLINGGWNRRDCSL